MNYAPIGRSAILGEPTYASVKSRCDQKKIIYGLIRVVLTQRACSHGRYYPSSGFKDITIVRNNSLKNRFERAAALALSSYPELLVAARNVSII